MTLILKQIFSFLKLLNSDTATGQISAGVVGGFILGMSPTLSLQSLLVFTVIFLFRVQLGAALASAFFFKFVAFLFDPVFHSVGSSILENESLQPLFTTLYNMPIVPFTRFNNSIVMGAAVISIALSPLIYILSQKLISKYRATVVAKFKETKFWKAVQATKFYQWYYKYDQIAG